MVLPGIYYRRNTSAVEGKGLSSVCRQSTCAVPQWNTETVKKKGKERKDKIWRQKDVERKKSRGR